MFRKLSFSLLFGLVLLFSQTIAQERVVSFVSDITVQPDGVLTVKEDITVLCQHKKIKRGIVREFPTSYPDTTMPLRRVVVDFDVQRVLLDGKPIHYELKSVSNGVEVHTGDDTFIPRGENTFTIEYTTTRQIGFFDDHDELYFNVNGTGWNFEFDKVRTIVRLPNSIPIESIKTTAYTGQFGARGTEYASKSADHMVEFWTTKKLAPFEGLTIVVGWQKGLITHPTPKQKIFYFLRDNALLLLLLWAIIGFLILLFIAVFSVFEARRINQSGVIVPLFYPPTGMAPSEVAFMTNLGFEEKSVAFDIVQLAVNGYITISSEGKSIFGKHTYTLTRTQKETLDEKEREPLNKIFSKSNSITLAHGQNQHLNSLVKQRKKQLENEYKSYISKKFREMATLVGMLWGIQVFAIVFFVAKPMIQELWVVGLGLFFLYGFAIAFCKLVYTKEGRALQDRIDGFKLFLVTTELERMKIIGTPPTKTPELYEHYLPYAMALGVEKQWTTQFATLFETLEKKGTPYRPRWYVGTSPFRGNFGQFGAQLGSSFASSIASSSTPPGRSSGFGGGGGSGRGGGGGGGRGR